MKMKMAIKSSGQIAHGDSKIYSFTWSLNCIELYANPSHSRMQTEEHKKLLSLITMNYYNQSTTKNSDDCWKMSVHPNRSVRCGRTFILLPLSSLYLTHINNCHGNCFSNAGLPLNILAFDEYSALPHSHLPWTFPQKQRKKDNIIQTLIFMTNT